MPQIYEQADGRWAYHANDGTVTSYNTEREARMAKRTPPEQQWADGAREIQAAIAALNTKIVALKALWDGNEEIWDMLLSTPRESAWGSSDMRAADVHRLLGLSRWYDSAGQQEVSITLPGTPEVTELWTPGKLATRIL